MFRIQIDTLQPGAISKSSTSNEGIYKGLINSAGGTFKLTPQSDFNDSPASLGLPSCPIRIKTAGGSVSLGPRFLPCVAAEGKTGGITAKGRASLLYDIGVVFRVVQDPPGPPQQKVNLLATGVMEGWTNIVPNSVVPGNPQAIAEAIIEIPGLDKITASSSTSGATTVTQGFTLSADQGASIAPQISKQVTSAGNIARAFHMPKLVPVNQPLVCQITLSLAAEGDALDVPVAGVLLREAASALLTVQYVHLIPDAPGTALVSSATASISLDVGGATLALIHPLSNLGIVTAAEGHEEGSVVESGLSVDYSGIRPEVDAVLVDGGGVPDDPLVGTLIGYPRMSLSGISPEGDLLLTGGPLTFTDAESGDTVATADLSNVRASVGTDTLSADVSNFTPIQFSLDASPISAAFNDRGGTLTFWSDAIEAIQAAAGFDPSGPGSTVLIAPNP